jgi:AcrR family transcriptional regulator
VSPQQASVQTARTEVRDRILDSFAEGARTDGPRNVVMAELARDLGISTRTLYRHFPSKAELVASLMDRWADEVERDHRARLDADTRSPYREMLESAELWLDGQCGFSPAFWAQLERDFPLAWERYQARLRAILDEGRRSLVEFIRDDLDQRLAMTLMQACLVAAADPERCEALGITRKEAVRQAIEVWVRGTLRPVRALHVEEPSD